jgi:acyl-CoA synthetase (AMP-forming)/AMP-acid ligase II
MAPLAAGSQVFCTPGFNALKFFAWMDEAKPTWFTAVPTMHQAIASRAPKNLDIIKRHPLRFMRSSSSSMPPQVIREAEEIFGAPLVEAYGMTEATHQMASNPLPPGARKPGTVGVAAGPEVGIMAEDGTLLPRGDTGEIVIRGPNVTAGYESNAKANAEAFQNGWFRTGDQGVMDAEGYISITGRLKEIINRGGEKVSPREVDEILMDHAAVAQVSACRTPSWAKRWRHASCYAKGKPSPNANCKPSWRSVPLTTRCPRRSCSWTRSRRAPPASCNALGSRRSSD